MFTKSLKILIPIILLLFEGSVTKIEFFWFNLSSKSDLKASLHYSLVIPNSWKITYSYMVDSTTSSKASSTYLSSSCTTFNWDFQV